MTKIKKQIKTKIKKHRHVWSYNYDICPNCGYEERCCKNCTVCEGRSANDFGWEEASS